MLKKRQPEIEIEPIPEVFAPSPPEAEPENVPLHPLKPDKEDQDQYQE